MMKLIVAVLCITQLSLLVCGCGNPKRPSYPVSKVVGTVRLDGRLLEKGRVQFVPGPSTPGGPVSGDVAAGEFEIADVPIGKHKVIFVATHETGKMISDRSEPYPEVINLVPDKYRDGIDAGVAASVSMQEFNLQSK